VSYCKKKQEKGEKVIPKESGEWWSGSWWLTARQNVA